MHAKRQTHQQHPRAVLAFSKLSIHTHTPRANKQRLASPRLRSFTLSRRNWSAPAIVSLATHFFASTNNEQKSKRREDLCVTICERSGSLHSERKFWPSHQSKAQIPNHSSPREYLTCVNLRIAFSFILIFALASHQSRTLHHRHLTTLSKLPE